jgi:hypothetical protein
VPSLVSLGCCTLQASLFLFTSASCMQSLLDSYAAEEQAFGSSGAGGVNQQQQSRQNADAAVAKLTQLVAQLQV